MVQQATTDAMRGRIGALGSAGQNGLADITAAATTGLAARIGPNLAVGTLAAITAIVGILLSFLAAQARRPTPAPDTILADRDARRRGTDEQDPAIGARSSDPENACEVTNLSWPTGLTASFI